ncbi:MAG: hypothetical protein ACXWBP_00155 [Limisphaerales bacterium]
MQNRPHQPQGFGLRVPRPTFGSPAALEFRAILSQPHADRIHGAFQVHYWCLQNAPKYGKVRLKTPKDTFNKKVLPFRKPTSTKVATFPATKLLQLATNCRKLPEVATFP